MQMGTSRPTSAERRGVREASTLNMKAEDLMHIKGFCESFRRTARKPGRSGSGRGLPRRPSSSRALAMACRDTVRPPLPARSHSGGPPLWGMNDRMDNRK